MKYLLPLLLTSSLLFANEELSFEEDFLQSLEDVSEIATKSKLNIDDAPSFVTVLHNDKLQKLGIDNVFEALAQVPGVQLKREASGVPVVVFRGVSQKGEVKLMIDGLSINNTYRGSIYHFLDFPIEMVERIEVIRGAGSVLYGSGAISGVINIITKSANDEDTNSVFVSGGSSDYYKGGAIVSSQIAGIKIAIDAYYQEKQKIIESTDRAFEDYSVGLKISDEHFAFITRVKKITNGNAYGVIDVYDTDRDKYDNTNDSLFAQISYNNDIGRDSNIELLAGYSQYGQKITSRSATYGDVDSSYHENSYYAQADFKSTILQNNELLLGTRFESAKAIDSQWKWATPNPALPQYNVTPNLTRDTSSLYLNDKYSLSSDLDISAGLRYDHYSDFGDAFTPTVGAVYRVTNKWRLKALYAQAYRAPSWVELTSNSDLKAETSNSLEAGVVYKEDQTSVVRLNVYKTRINDLITKNRSYSQTEYADFMGTEFEFMFTPNNQLELNFFASYVQAKDQNGEDLADVANTLATLSSVYEFDLGITAGGLFKYIGSSKRSNNPAETRDSAQSSIIVDGTLSYEFKDITASFILKDIFDKGTYYALPTSATNNDFYDGGRTVLLKASWDF